MRTLKELKSRDLVPITHYRSLIGLNGTGTISKKLIPEFIVDLKIERTPLSGDYNEYFDRRNPDSYR